MLDREALRQYRKRLADLDEELDDAEAKHDAARHAKRSTEREALLKELARATGLGGKPRRTGSPTEKARLNVTRTIRHAITYLSTALPELAAHLDESLATGVRALRAAHQHRLDDLTAARSFRTNRGRTRNERLARGGNDHGRHPELRADDWGLCSGPESRLRARGRADENEEGLAEAGHSL